MVIAVGAARVNLVVDRSLGAQKNNSSISNEPVENKNNVKFTQVRKKPKNEQEAQLVNSFFDDYIEPRSGLVYTFMENLIPEDFGVREGYYSDENIRHLLTHGLLESLSMNPNEELSSYDISKDSFGRDFIGELRTEVAEPIFNHLGIVGGSTGVRTDFLSTQKSISLEQLDFSQRAFYYEQVANLAKLLYVNLVSYQEGAASDSKLFNQTLRKLNMVNLNNSAATSKMADGLKQGNLRKQDYEQFGFNTFTKDERELINKMILSSGLGDVVVFKSILNDKGELDFDKVKPLEFDEVQKVANWAIQSANFLLNKVQKQATPNEQATIHDKELSLKLDLQDLNSIDFQDGQIFPRIFPDREGFTSFKSFKDPLLNS